MNRLAALVVTAEANLAKLPVERVEELGKKLDLSFEEHFIFQEKKSLAYASGKLSLDEATFLYEKLGGTASVFNAQSVAVKIVLTQTFAILLAS